MKISLLRIQTMISNGEDLRVKMLKFSNIIDTKSLSIKSLFVIADDRRENMSCRVHCEAPINAFKKALDVALILCVRRKRKFSSFMQSRQQKEKKVFVKMHFRSKLHFQHGRELQMESHMSERERKYLLSSPASVRFRGPKHHRFESFL